MANKKTIKKPAVKKPAAKKTTVKKAAVKKPVSKKAAVKKAEVKKVKAIKPAAKKAAAKKTTVKKTAVKKPAVNKKEVKTKTAAKKPAASKTKQVKQLTPKKPAVKEVKKPAAGKTIVKKTAAKKTKNVKTNEWISVDKYCEGLNLKRAPAEIKKATPKKSPIMLTNEELANFYMLQEKYDDLLILCKNMLDKKETKDSPLWLEKMSDILCHFGEWQKAIEINKKRTSLFPKEWPAWNTLASVLAVLGDYKSAAGALKEAEEKINWDIPYDEPDMDKNPPVKEEFFAFSKEGDPSTFCDIFWPKNAMFILYPKILEKVPGCAFGWYTLAKFYGDILHYYDEAVGAVEKVVQIKPDWKPALAYQAQMLSYVQKMSIDDGHYMDTEQRKIEKKKKQETGAKAEKAYEKWDSEKALARKNRKE